jgi:hypothetical protein
MPIARSRDFVADLQAFKAAASATGIFLPQDDDNLTKEEKAFADLRSWRAKAWSWGVWVGWVVFLFLMVKDAANRSILFAITGTLGLWWRLRSQNRIATTLSEVHRDVARTQRQLHAHRFGDASFSKQGTQVGSPDDLSLLRHWLIENWQIRTFEKYRDACLGAEYPDETEAMVGHIPWESQGADEMRGRGTYDRVVFESWKMACALRGNDSSDESAAISSNQKRDDPPGD